MSKSNYTQTMTHRLLSLAALLLWAASLGAQGAITGFMPKPGQTDLAVSYADERFDTYVFGTTEQASFLRTLSFNFFAEHGLSKRSSVVLALPFVHIDAENRGLQDANLALKYRNEYKEYDSGNFSAITAVGLSFPATRYRIDTPNPIGQRATVMQARLVLQYNDYAGWFVNAHTGLDFRLIPDVQVAVPTLVRGGYGSKQFYVEAWLEYFHTFNAGTDGNISGGTGSRWWRTGATLYVPVTQQFGVLGGAAFVLAGQNIGLSDRWNAGAVYKLGVK